ncbi:MAG: Fe-S-containing hydro-lyase [Treponema sp.]|nr:Fe-S-containing hydro-lyase [Treponema sp.]
MRELFTPIEDETIELLSVGETLYLSGTIITARDAAHLRLVEMIERGEEFPPHLELQGRAVFYAGPSPAKPGRPIGSIGPTTAGRMDLYAPLLMSKGIKVMIGKGLRSPEVIKAIVQYRGIYFAAIGGAAALMAKCVRSAKVIAFDDLGTEAIRELVIEKFPVTVAIDSQGRNLYEQGRREYSRV